MNAFGRITAPDVTVIVPTLGARVLQGCLDSLADGTRWPACLIVVNQGSATDAEPWISGLRERGIDVLHIGSEPVGIAAATNLGLQRVRTRFAAITHDDCVVQRDWLERMAARLGQVGDAILTGQVEPSGDGIVLTVKMAANPAVYTTPLVNGDVLFPPNMGFDVRLLDRIGWFDEHPSLATAGEDNEWAHRALRAGVAIVYDPTIRVWHLARHRSADLPGLYRRYARGQGAFYGTWLRRGDGFIAVRVARDLLRAPWLVLRGLATGNAELTAMGRAEVTGLVPGIVAGLRNTGVRAALGHQSTLRSDPGSTGRDASHARRNR